MPNYVLMWPIISLCPNLPSLQVLCFWFDKEKIGVWLYSIQFVCLFRFTKHCMHFLMLIASHKILAWFTQVCDRKIDCFLYNISLLSNYSIALMEFDCFSPDWKLITMIFLVIKTLFTNPWFSIHFFNSSDFKNRSINN